MQLGWHLGVESQHSGGGSPAKLRHLLQVVHCVRCIAQVVVVSLFMWMGRPNEVHGDV